jgi:repressor LexA
MLCKAWAFLFPPSWQEDIIVKVLFLIQFVESFILYIRIESLSSVFIHFVVKFFNVSYNLFTGGKMDRLRQLRKSRKLTQEEVGKHLGITAQSYSNYENDNREPDFATVSKLADYFNVSVDYLLGREEKKEFSIFDFPNIYPIRKRNFRVLGEVACGTPMFANEERELYVENYTDVKADFVVMARGDSMVNARICDGDIVFIRQQDMVENGEIAVVAIDDTITLKRVFYSREKNEFILNAENPQYPPLVYRGAELNSIRILGKAIAFQSDVK